MPYYLVKHQFTCGVDLHGRNLYLCVLDRDGEKLLHRRVGCDPRRLLKVLAPFRGDLVIGVECMFKWYWLADLCSENDIEFVLGHALDMRAVHGAKSGNDRLDAERIARLLLGGLFPIAYVYPAGMRSVRDLMRRRSYHVRRRSDLFNHIQMKGLQDNLDPFGKIARASLREGIEDRFTDPAVRCSVEADLALVDLYDVVIPRLEKRILDSAKGHDHHALSLLKSINGVGDVIGLTLMYEIHAIHRFASVGRFLSYSCLVKCKKTSDGKVKGVGGSKRGNLHLKNAFSEAAVHFLRSNGKGQALHSRLVKKHGPQKALAVLAAKLGRAVYFMLLRTTPFDLDRFVAA